MVQFADPILDIDSTRPRRKSLFRYIKSVNKVRVVRMDSQEGVECMNIYDQIRETFKESSTTAHDSQVMTDEEFRAQANLHERIVARFLNADVLKSY